MKTYSFNLKGNPLRVNMEERNGQVILGRFRPDYLLVTYGSPFFGDAMTTLAEYEFKNDCQKIVDCFNQGNYDYRDGADCLKVLTKMVEDHIRTYGHIFIGDLMILTGELCELMSAMGYDDVTLKAVFPNFVASIVQQKGTSVKDDTPNPFMTFGSKPGPFIGTSRHNRLISNCPHMNEYPRLSSKSSPSRTSFWDIFKKK